MKEKIYIRIIDGSEAWIPIGAEQVGNNQFSIDSFDDFDPGDTTVIPQFIPGDIVTRKQLELDGRKFWAADMLIKSSDNIHKKYFEFLYRTVTGDKLKNNEERLQYKSEIIRTSNEIREGKYHYPAIVNYVTGIITV